MNSAHSYFNAYVSSAIYRLNQAIYLAMDGSFDRLVDNGTARPLCDSMVCTLEAVKEMLDGNLQHAAIDENNQAKLMMIRHRLKLIIDQAGDLVKQIDEWREKQ